MSIHVLPVLNQLRLFVVITVRRRLSRTHVARLTRLGPLLNLRLVLDHAEDTRMVHTLIVLVHIESLARILSHWRLKATAFIFDNRVLLHVFEDLLLDSHIPFTSRLSVLVHEV